MKLTRRNLIQSGASLALLSGCQRHEGPWGQDVAKIDRTPLGAVGRPTDTAGVQKIQAWAGVVRMLSGNAGTLLLAVTVLLVIYSRLIGMGALWESLLSDGYLRTAKNFVEEGSELMAYGVITVAALVRLAQS